MTFDEYQLLARRTQNGRLSREQKEDHALHGLSGEVGEIHAIYQKELQGHEFSTAHALSELGDLLWFMAELADALDASLSEIAAHNIDKLRARYPEGFSEENSVHRADGDI